MKKVLVTGATGLLGKMLCRRLADLDYEISVLTRSVQKAKKEIPAPVKPLLWDYKKPEEWQHHIEGQNAVIHLAGENLFAHRWTDEVKSRLMESRKTGTLNVAKNVRNAKNKPEVLISASGVGIYGNTGKLVVNESTPAGDDFLADVCKEWEAAAAYVEDSGVRRVSMRTVPVLSTQGGALKKMLTPFKLFVGGPLGKGTQWLSWIHIADAVDGYIFALENKKISGAVNLCSPNPVIMKEFAETLGDVINRPSFFKVPEFALKIAVGEAGEILTYSQKVSPEKLIKEGFTFKFPNLANALTDIIENDL